MLKNLIMVPIIMGFAIVGTVGIIKGINKINPNEKKEDKDKEKNNNE